jgi:muconolactone delta-isomerase
MGLWRAVGHVEFETVMTSLPLHRWMLIATEPESHPNAPVLSDSDA